MANAAKLIADNRQTRSEFLDLGNCGLKRIPKSVADLHWLTRLSFASERYESAFGHAEFSDNKGNPNVLESLTPLSGLTQLRALYLNESGIEDLSPLASLVNLEILDISDNHIADLRPLRELVRLEMLIAWAIDITSLDGLEKLKSLRELDLAWAKVTDVSLLAGHARLQTIDLSRSYLTDLSPLIGLMRRGCGIYVTDCPLTSPPVEIAEQGTPAILNYFAEREAGDVDHLYEAKLLILGEGGAGKTTLVRRLYQPDAPMPKVQETTRGIDIQRHDFTLKNGRRFRLNIWDFGGQEIYHATHQFFLTRRSLYLLLDDTRKDHKSVSDEGFKYWLELIDLFGGHSPVLIFQNEKAGRSKAIDLAGIKGQYDNVKDKYAGNLEFPDSVTDVREAIEFHASQLKHVGDELPARWLAVRAELEERARQVPYISQSEYFDVYRRFIEFDRTRALFLSRYLHDLGVFLHFQDDPLLARTVILQNSWATEAVFRILDDEDVRSRFGRFTQADCERVWAGSSYADMHPELIALMQRFELCYVLADTRPQTWLSPQLLPPAKPGSLQDRPGGDGGDVVLRYRYQFLPKGLISRLTVRLHRFVRNPEMAWVTGVLFEHDKTSVLVELLPNGQEIELRGRGPQRGSFIKVVAADLDALNESFPGLADRVDKRIPCTCATCEAAPVPEFFAERSLRRRVEDRRPTIECPSSYENVQVGHLLDGVRAESLPEWAKEASGRTVRIFLASSSELHEDRDAFDLYVRRLNDSFRRRGVYFEVVRWEHFLDAMSSTRLQDEYNKAVRACDIFVSLFFTKTGQYTEEEFDTAHRHFVDTTRPFIYTFFKNADIKTGEAREEDLSSLWRFQKKLETLGHYQTKYDNIDQLKGAFREQLDELCDSVFAVRA